MDFSSWGSIASFIAVISPILVLTHWITVSVIKNHLSQFEEKFAEKLALKFEDKKYNELKIDRVLDRIGYVESRYNELRDYSHKNIHSLREEVQVKFFDLEATVSTTKTKLYYLESLAGPSLNKKE